MLRTYGTRSLLKSFNKAPTSRASYSAASATIKHVLPPRTLSNRRPQILSSLSRPTINSLLYATKAEPPFDHIDKKAEDKIAHTKIEPHPEIVSGVSSVRAVFEEPRAPQEAHGSVKDDLNTIKETFALYDVPRESLVIGAAGVLPYAATSASTVWLAYDINHAHAHDGNGILFSPELAHQLLDYITPIQVGYGAVVSTNLQIGT